MKDVGIKIVKGKLKCFGYVERKERRLAKHGECEQAGKLIRADKANLP